MNNVNSMAANLTTILVASGLVLLARPGSAQQPDSAAHGLGSLKALSVEQLMGVEVTSVSKRAERLLEAPAAVQVITQEEIRRSGVTSLPEALRLATNLQVAQVDSRQWAVSARGFNGTAANKLLALIDGRTVYTPLYSGVFWDAQDTPLADIDRIEVISGPGATLWGANAVNGVINITTRNAAETRGLVVTGGGGSMLREFGGLRYGGAFNPNAHYRAYVKGYGREPSVLPNGTDATDDWHMGQGGFRFDWDGAGKDRITLQGDIYDGRIAQANPNDIVVGGGNVLGRWSRTFSEQSDLRLQLYYDRTHRSIPGTFAEDLDTYDLDFQHRFPLGSRHDLVWGVGIRPINDTVTNTTSLAFLPSRVWRKWFTGFAQDEITLVENRLHLILGTKIEHNDYTGIEVQPSGRLNWKVQEEHTVWAAVSRAVRAPSRIDREFFAPAAPPYFLAGGPNFVSEELLAYELGYRAEPLPAVALSLSTFYNRYHGVRSLEQVNPPAPFPLVFANGQSGKSYGAELTAEYRVSAVWRLRAGYTEMRVRIRPNAGSTDITQGSTESHDPDRHLIVGSSVDLPGRVTLDGQFHYVSQIANQSVPAYAELGARLGWQPAPNLELSLVGQNLLHEHHPEFGAGAARREIPRSVYGSVAWHF